jgi:hypothetical protein
LQTISNRAESGNQVFQVAALARRYLPVTILTSATSAMNLDASKNLGLAGPWRITKRRRRPAIGSARLVLAATLLANLCN